LLTSTNFELAVPIKKLKATSIALIERSSDSASKPIMTTMIKKASAEKILLTIDSSGRSR
jgi:hypothetical protein